MEDIPEKEIKETDGVLIVRYSQGDEAAFNQLYKRHRRELYRYLLQKTEGNKTLSDDILQKTWEKMIRYRAIIAVHAKKGDFDGEVIENGKIKKPFFLAYLKTIATNILIDHYRSPKSKEQSLDSLLNDDTLLDADGDIHNNGQSFEYKYLTAPIHEQPQEQYEQQDRLDRMLHQLKDEHRMILKWRYVKDLSLKEIEKLLPELKPEGVRSRLQTAIKNFKKLYKKEIENDDKKAITKE